jgi:hypothetical protein
MAKRGKRVFIVRSRYAKGDTVFQKGMKTPLTVTAVCISIGYETDDDRFFSDGELRLAPFNSRHKEKEKMQLTNAQIGDLIDALQIAARARRAHLYTKFSVVAIKDRGRHLELNEKEKYVEWITQIRRYYALRRYLLQVERSNLKSFPKLKRS